MSKLPSGRAPAYDGPMDLSNNASEQAFREQVRAFVRAHLPQDLRRKVASFAWLEKGDFERWHNILADHGWQGPSWPREHGGAGLTAVQRKIFDEECQLACAPRVIPHLNMISPVLHEFGTPAQKAKFLPDLFRLKTWWCQGYSEPGSGSDLASLKTSAVRGRDAEGEHYLVNGQKIWTTWAHWADWMFALVRTNREAKAQEGISFVLIDMKSPGVTVRPIISADGGHDLNEVYFDNVRVPVENLVGQENQGWTVAKFLLGFERAEMAAVGLCKRLLHFARQAAQTHYRAGAPLWDDPLMRQRLAELEMRVQVHEWTVMRVLSSEDGGRHGGAAASVLKLTSTELQQELTRALMDCTGPRGVQYLRAARRGEAVEAGHLRAFDNALAANYIDWRKATIYGGTTEVQKSIAAKTFL
ncbi:acyl-CoA dehydrogenase family protein [Comamonas humi]